MSGQTHVVQYDIDTSTLQLLDVLPRFEEVVLEHEFGSSLDRLQLLNLLVRKRGEQREIRCVSCTTSGSAKSSESILKPIRLTPQADFQHRLPVGVQDDLIVGLAFLHELLHRLGESVNTLGRAAESLELLRCEAVEGSPVLGAGEESSDAAVPVEQGHQQASEGVVNGRRTCSTRRRAMKR